MSRGGPRRGGRGGGGAGRGIGPGGAMEMPAHSDMSKNEWNEYLRTTNKHSGKLFPPLEPKLFATLPAPVPFEEQTIALATSLSLTLSTGQVGTSKIPTPWRIINEKKTIGIEIETWSDRRQKEEQMYAGGSGMYNGSSTNGKLDMKALYLDERYFPPVLWKEVFEGVEATDGPKRKAGVAGSKKKSRRIDSPADGEDDEEKDKEGLEDKSARGSESEGGDDFDFEDDEENDDYDANYFDNGEGDDDDEGGDDEDGDRDGYNDN